MFKFNIGEVPKPISNLFMVSCFFHSHTTRSVGYLHTPLGKSEASYRTFNYIGIHIWKHISQNVSINISNSKFKFLTKFYILNNKITIIRLNAYIQLKLFFVMLLFITCKCFHLLKLYEHCTMHYIICIDVFF